MKKLLFLLITFFTISIASAQIQTDNNVRIPNNDILILSAQRPRTDKVPVQTIRDTIRQKGSKAINESYKGENSNAIKVDVNGAQSGTIASPIGAEPQKSTVKAPDGSTPNN